MPVKVQIVELKVLVATLLAKLTLPDGLTVPDEVSLTVTVQVVP